MSSLLSAEPVLDHKCLLGEGPVWNSHRKTISWVDILRCEIHEYSEVTYQHSVVHVGDMVGSFAFTADGDYFAALKNGLALVDRDSGEVTYLHNPEAHLPGNRFNEGKCDPSGRFWVGSMALSEEPGAGNLFRVEPDLSYTMMVAGVSISNGLAWSMDEKTLYYIDSPTRQVVAYDFDLRNGGISGRRVVIRMKEAEGFPDGMTIDREGMLWIGQWDGWQVGRWDPSTGTKIGTISLPVARVTSCTFGGKDLTDLYITSARTGLTEEQLKDQPLAGSLFVVRNTGFTGLEPFAFQFQ